MSITKRTKYAVKLLCLALAVCLSGVLTIPARAAYMSVSQSGIDFIKSHESFSENMYSYGDSWYIGYGTSCDENEYPDGITEEEGDELLRIELQKIENAVNKFIDDTGLRLEQNQYDALVSFTYNLGTGWLSGNSDLVNIVKGKLEADRDKVIDAFGIWCHIAGDPNEKLAERRIQEALMYLDGNYSAKADEEYSYIIFECAGGDTPRDILFYRTGKAYGTLPSASRSGYTFEGWTSKDGTQVLIGHTVQKSCTLYAKWSSNRYKNSFPDVGEDKWFYHYIMELSDKKVIEGYPDGNYGPYDVTTTGAAVTLIMRAVGHEKQGAADNHWAGGYMNLAHDKGFLNKNDFYDYDGEISRLDIAQIAAKALGLRKSGDRSPYIDVDDGYVTALYNEGIMEGSITGMGREFAPGTSITRGEIAAVIWRIEQFENKNTEKITYKQYTVDVLKDVPKSTIKSDGFFTRNGFKGYSDDTREGVLGVDVSHYQGDIDWEKVKADGMEYAIIRVGGRGYGTEGRLYDDNMFDKNMQGAIDAGLDVGVYFFSQAITAKEAKEEAEYVLEKIKNYNVTAPVVFDWEVIGKESARTYGLPTKTLCEAANTFCSMIEDAGYTPMIYFTSYSGYVKYDLSKVLDYQFWFAEYNVSKPSFYYDIDMWQYTDKGSVDGIKGNADVNLYFKKK